MAHPVLLKNPFLIEECAVRFLQNEACETEQGEIVNVWKSDGISIRLNDIGAMNIIGSPTCVAGNLAVF